MPKTLATAVSSELIIKKSRFIGCVRPAAGREEALQVVAGLRRAHANANHVCWALLAGGQSAAVDDGEPGGTSGQPTLAVLQGAGLTDVCCVTTRYFGGTLLGSGGLVRAYSSAVSETLDRAPIVRRALLDEVLVDERSAPAGREREHLARAAALFGAELHVGDLAVNGTHVHDPQRVAQMVASVMGVAPASPDVPRARRELA